jgi:hypothetical protein
LSAGFYRNRDTEATVSLTKHTGAFVSTLPSTKASKPTRAVFPAKEDAFSLSLRRAEVRSNHVLRYG